jgi:hypothetical protein
MGGSIGAISQEVASGESPTGSEASDLSGIESLEPASKPDRSRSQRSQFKQHLLVKIACIGLQPRGRDSPGPSDNSASGWLTGS